MDKLLMYCLAIDDSLKNKIKELNHIPVGLGDNNLLWGGVSYRLEEGVVFLTGVKIRQKDSDIKFGIGYDVVMSKIDNNSIEFMVGYSYNLQPDRSVKSYKNPRYL